MKEAKLKEEIRVLEAYVRAARPAPSHLLRALVDMKRAYHANKWCDYHGSPSCPCAK